MEELISILESKRTNCSRGIERALGQTDTTALARILNALDSKYHKYFFQNMTARAVVILEKEMEIQKGVLKSLYNKKYDEFEEEVENFCSVLKLYTNEKFDKRFEYPSYSGDLNFDTTKETVETLYQLGDFSRQNGLMALNGIIDKSSSKMFNKSLELLLMGIEPFRFEELLENYKTQYLDMVEKNYSMIIKGIRGLYDGDHPEMIREKLKSVCEE